MDRCEEMLFIPLITLVWLSFTQGNTFQPVSSTCIYWNSLTRYTNGEEQKLHCILDENGIEGLVNTTWKLIGPGFCPIFNRHGKEVDKEVCDNNLGRCPNIHIRSYQATQYNACYGKARQGGRSGTEFKEHQLSQGITNHYYGNTNRIHPEVALVILFLLLIFFLGVIAYLMYVIRKERKKSRNISQGKLGGDDAVPLVQHSKTEEYVNLKNEKDDGNTEADDVVSSMSQMNREEYDRQVQVKYVDIVFLLEKFTYNRVEEFKNGNKDACEALKPDGMSKLSQHLTNAVMQKCDIKNCCVLGTHRLPDEGKQNGDHMQLKFNFTVEGNTEADDVVSLVSVRNTEEYDRPVQVKYDDIVFLLEKFTYNRVEEFKNGNKDACEALKPDDMSKLSQHLTNAVMQKCDIKNCCVLRNASNEGTPRLRNEGIQNGDRVQLKFNFTVEGKLGADDTVPLVQHSNTEEYEHLKYENFNDIAFMLEKVTNKRVKEFKNGNKYACEALKPDDVSKLQTNDQRKSVTLTSTVN